VITATTIFAIVLQFFIIIPPFFIFTFLPFYILIRLGPKPQTLIAIRLVAATGVAASVATVAAVASRLSGVNIVLRRLLHTATSDKGLLTLTITIGLYLGLKQHMQAFDILAYAEVGCLVGSLASDTDLKRSKAVQLYTLRVLQLVGHGLNQLTDHCQDISLLHGTVTLHDFSQLVGVDGLSDYGTWIPFAIALGFR
jgi:hypothetical protein